MATYPAMSMMDQSSLAAYNATAASMSGVPIGYPPTISNPPVPYQQAPPPPPPPQQQYPAAAIAQAAAAAANYQYQQRQAQVAAAAIAAGGDGVAQSQATGGGPVTFDPKCNLIVNYLPQTMSQDELKALFVSMGEVSSCRLVKDKLTGQSLGYGFVNFTRQEDAQKAVNSLNGMRLQNKSIKVSFARPSSEIIKGANLYISGLSKTLTQPELEQMFASFGHIITSRILTDPTTGESKGVGFVRFDNKNEAEQAIAQLNGTIPTGGTDPLTVKFANTPATAGQKAALQVAQAAGLMPFAFPNSQGRLGPIHPTASAAGRYRYSPLGPAVPPQAAGFCIFVFNLAPETEEPILWQLFGPFGAVLSVKIIRDLQTNKCKGYGFVTMAIYEEAFTAITHLHGTTLAGRVLQISFKTQSTKKA